MLKTLKYQYLIGWMMFCSKKYVTDGSSSHKLIQKVGKERKNAEHSALPRGREMA